MGMVTIANKGTWLVKKSKKRNLETAPKNVRRDQFWSRCFLGAFRVNHYKYLSKLNRLTPVGFPIVNESYLYNASILS